MIELWQKMTDVKIQTNHANIADAALKRIRKYCGKKAKDITEEEKKAFFQGEAGIFIIEKLTPDIIECCKLPEAIELRKKLGYNHDNIMIRKRNVNSRKNNKTFP